jgi:hypothetical protein
MIVDKYEINTVMMRSKDDSYAGNYVFDYYTGTDRHSSAIFLKCFLLNKVGNSNGDT